jgi:hypothetical protein
LCCAAHQPGHLQAWIRVSLSPLDPAIATSIAVHLATLYGADRASADWRHCGRLAGFTNQKPARCQPSGYAPWAILLDAQPRLATQAAPLLEAAPHHSPTRPSPLPVSRPSSLTPAGARNVYSRWLHRLQIPQRFSPPHWSIADLWIAERGRR